MRGPEGCTPASGPQRTLRALLRAPEGGGGTGTPAAGAGLQDSSRVWPPGCRPRAWPPTRSSGEPRPPAMATVPTAVGPLPPPVSAGADGPAPLVEEGGRAGVSGLGPQLHQLSGDNWPRPPVPPPACRPACKGETPGLSAPPPGTTPDSGEATLRGPNLHRPTLHGTPPCTDPPYMGPHPTWTHPTQGPILHGGCGFGNDKSETNHLKGMLCTPLLVTKERESPTSGGSPLGTVLPLVMGAATGLQGRQRDEAP